jgi:hypothetical protein
MFARPQSIEGAPMANPMFFYAGVYDNVHDADDD